MQDDRETFRATCDRLKSFGLERQYVARALRISPAALSRATRCPSAAPRPLAQPPRGWRRTLADDLAHLQRELEVVASEVRPSR